MGFFTSQGMKVKLMVCKDSKKNEQEMLGNKIFYKKCKNQPLFNKKDFFFFSNFSKISCSKHKGISLNLGATYALNALQKTYEKRLLPSY
jgi:hypothetical protein